MRTIRSRRVRRRRGRSSHSDPAVVASAQSLSRSILSACLPRRGSGGSPTPLLHHRRGAVRRIRPWPGYRRYPSAAGLRHCCCPRRSCSNRPRHWRQPKRWPKSWPTIRRWPRLPDPSQRMLPSRSRRSPKPRPRRLPTMRWPRRRPSKHSPRRLQLLRQLLTVCCCGSRRLRGGVSRRRCRSGGTGVVVRSGRSLCVRVIVVVRGRGCLGCLVGCSVGFRGRVGRGLRGGLFVGGGFGGCFSVLVGCCRCRVVGIVVGSCLSGCLGDRVVVVIGVGRSRGRSSSVHIGIRIGVIRSGGRGSVVVAVSVSRCVGRSFRRRSLRSRQPMQLLPDSHQLRPRRSRSSSPCRRRLRRRWLPAVREALVSLVASAEVSEEASSFAADSAAASAFSSAAADAVLLASFIGGCLAAASATALLLSSALAEAEAEAAAFTLAFASASFAHRDRCGNRRWLLRLQKLRTTNQRLKPLPKRLRSSRPKPSMPLRSCHPSYRHLRRRSRLLCRSIGLGRRISRSLRRSVLVSCRLCRCFSVLVSCCRCRVVGIVVAASSDAACAAGLLSHSRRPKPMPKQLRSHGIRIVGVSSVWIGSCRRISVSVCRRILRCRGRRIRSRSC